VRPFGSSVRQAGATAAPASADQIEVTIATGGGLHGPVRSQFKVGEDIPVVISMTNTGDKPTKYCLSTAVIQNRPQLVKDGRLIPYLTNLPELVDNENATQRCENSAFRKFYVLKPKQKRVVDWITISQRSLVWYEVLSPGHYELILMRRIECCRGPFVESNKVTFDVVP
jgi:hypothetical protein